MPPPHHVDDVAQSRAGGGRDDADAVWKRGQRTLACGVEQPFRGKTAFELLKRKLQGAFAAWPHAFRDEL